jgi:hypothetical protein
MSIAAGTTFSSFVKQLARSTPAVARSHFLRNQVLFAARPEFIEKAVGALPWQNALAILSAAYYTQDVPPQAYHAAIRSVLRSHSSVQAARGRWSDAFRALSIAVEGHGNQVPPRAYADAVACCAQSRAWEPALRLTKLADARGLASSDLLVNAALAAGTPATWRASFSLLEASGLAVNLRSKETGTTTRAALMRALSCAPWRQTLRLLESPPMKALLSPQDRRALRVACSPWFVALRLAKRREAVEALRGAPPSVALPALAATTSTLQVSERAVMLEKFCHAGRWQEAMMLLMADHGHALLALAPRAVAAAIILAHQAGDDASVAAIGNALADTNLPLQRNAADAVLVSMVRARADWARTMLTFVALRAPEAPSRPVGEAALPFPGLNSKTLSLLITACATQQKPRTALRLLGAARARNGVELVDHERLQALLFCMEHARWREAAAIFAHCEDGSVRRRLEPIVLAVMAARRG